VSRFVSFSALGGVLLLFSLSSCHNAFNLTGIENHHDPEPDKVSIVVNNWSQDSNGNVIINYSIQETVDETLDFVKVSFSEDYTDGPSNYGTYWTYVTINNPVAHTTYAGTVTETKTQGHHVTRVSPYGYEDGATK